MGIKWDADLEQEGEKKEGQMEGRKRRKEIYTQRNCNYFFLIKASLNFEPK